MYQTLQHIKNGIDQHSNSHDKTKQDQDLKKVV